MKPEDALSSSRRSEILAIGNSSRDRSRYLKSTKEKLYHHKIWKYDEQFAYFCYPIASYCILCIKCLTFWYDDFAVHSNKFNKTWLSIQMKKRLEVGFYCLQPTILCHRLWHNIWSTQEKKWHGCHT